MKRHVLLRKLIEFDSRLDERIFGEGESGKQEPRKKAVELSIVPLLGGVAAGNIAGTLASRKRRLTDGTWVDSQGNPTNAPVLAPAIGVGAGVGAVAAHQSIMRNYGGEAAGAGEAYRNVGRNVTHQAADFLAGRKSAAMAGAAQGRAIGENIGAKSGEAIGNVLEKLKKLKGAASPFLRRVGLDRKMPQLVEFEEKIDKIVFDKPGSKKVESGKQESRKKPVQFDLPASGEAKRRANPIKAATVGVAAGATAGFLRSPGRARLMATSAKHGFKVGYATRKLAEKLGRRVAA